MNAPEQKPDTKVTDETGEEVSDWPQQQVEDIGDQRMDVPTTDLKPEDKKRK